MTIIKRDITTTKIPETVCIASFQTILTGIFIEWTERYMRVHIYTNSFVEKSSQMFPQ